MPLPGPCALAAAVSAAGLVAERFVFAGFLPQQAKARRALLSTLAGLPFAVVVYEAPHRVRDTVADLVTAFGDERTLVIAREISKRFEEIVRLRAGDAAAWFDADENRVRGEFVVVIGPPAADIHAMDADQLDSLLHERLAGGSLKDAVAEVVEASGRPRREVYARALELTRQLHPNHGDEED